MRRDETGSWVGIVVVASSLTLMALAAYALIQGSTASVLLMAACVPYLAVGTKAIRQPLMNLPVPGVAVAVGGALAIVECTNIVLEEFISLQPPANAIAPASAMGLIVLAAAVSAALVTSSFGIRAGILTAIASVAFGMVVSCAIALLLIVLLGPHRESLDLSQEVTNAATHLVAPVLVAAGIGAVTGLYVRAFRSRRALAAIAAGGLVVLALGIFLLVRAASLRRSDRPPLVVSGMLLSTMGITMLPGLLSLRGSSRLEKP